MITARTNSLARHVVARGKFCTTSVALGAALALSGPLSANAAPPETVAKAMRANSFAPGRILVEARAGLPGAEFDKILAPYGGMRRKVGQSNLNVVEVPSNGSEQAVIEQLMRNPNIKYAEVDRLVAPSFVPNDPYFGIESHLSVIGAGAAWDMSRGAGVTIAILDSGVDSTHPDLAGQLLPGYNFYDNNGNTADVNGHGTAVAGTAAAAINNGQGVAGIAGQAKILPVRISGADGWAYVSTIAQGLTWAADHGARVANCSYEGLADSAAIQSAAAYMKAKGGLVVVSAGNSGTNQPIAPTTTMIPVSATDNNDNFASWSSSGNYVAMSAPGSVWTTSRGGNYQQWNGTSFSSPLVAGVVALMMSANPALDAPALENLLFKTSVDLGNPGRDSYFGWGRVNAAAAVQGARAAIVPIDRNPPSVAFGSRFNGSSVSGVTVINVSASDDVGVARVELQVAGTTVAVDNAAPFSFSWDSTGVPNGMVGLRAIAFDAAGNVGASQPVTVYVANATSPRNAGNSRNVGNVASPPNVGNVGGIRGGRGSPPTPQAPQVPQGPQDTSPPLLKITNPQTGSVAGDVAINVEAADDSGAAGISISIYVDGVQRASGSGGALAANWNTAGRTRAGVHTITAVAKDAAGNSATTSVEVTK